MAEGVPPVPHLDVKRAIVRPVSRKLAEQIILKYEWLGTMAATRWHYGIFYGTYCSGVCCVGTTNTIAGSHFHEQFGVTPDKILILARGACVHWAPKGTNTKLVSWTCRLVRRDMGAKVIAAFSDTDAGEIGTIYQACGWVYIGRGKDGRKDGEYIDTTGRIHNRIILQKVARRNSTTTDRARELLIAHGWSIQKFNGKHKYVCILDKTDKALIERVERMRQPYPKRGTGETDNAPRPNVETGGASPTVPL